MATTDRTILVGGMISGVPYQGGWTWAMLQFLLGFKELGFDVCFVESLPQSAILPVGASLETSTNAAYFRQVMCDFGFDQQSALILEGTEQSVGLPFEKLRQAARRSEIFLNVSGSFVNEALTSEIPVRLYLDLDPAFTQIWHEAEHIDLHLSGHTHFATIGLALGKPDCNVPTCGLEWIPTVQPVVLKHWPQANGFKYDALTTVANWRGYGSVEFDGVFYGQKAHSLREFISLPLSTREKFLLALAIHPNEVTDLSALERNEWELIDPSQVAATPQAYQKFVRDSKAEFGIAKSGYVQSRCAWFSDRSVCYLASGRPVIAQDTGFSAFLPTGEGLFAFETENEILSAVAALRSDYAHHARAARLIAEQHFDSGTVLSELLRRVGIVA